MPPSVAASWRSSSHSIASCSRRSALHGVAAVVCAHPQQGASLKRVAL